jgi:hypothetical protein
MYLATCEDQDGMWWDDPISADTRDDAKAIALKRWKDVPEGIAIVLWRCTSEGEVDRPVPVDAPRPLAA